MESPAIGTAWKNAGALTILLAICCHVYIALRDILDV